MKNDFILNIILGKFITIINNPKQKYNSLEDFSFNKGKHLLKCYYYSLYEMEKKRLLKSNKLIKYNMYDWRDENKDILKLYDDIQLIHSMGAIVIDWLRDVDLVEYDLVKSLDDENKRHLNIIKVSKRLEKIIKQIKLPLNLPHNLPMIVKPKLCSRGINKKGEIIEYTGGN